MSTGCVGNGRWATRAPTPSSGSLVDPEGDTRTLAGPPSTQGSAWVHYVALLVVAWVVIVVVAGTALVRIRAQASRDQEEHFRVRTELAARFVGSYVASVHGRQRAWASALLSGPTVTPAQLRLPCVTLDFVSCGLFADDGKLIMNAPYLPRLIGRNFRQLEQVAVALRTNAPSVAQVAVAPSLGAPAVAVGVPYSTPSGRRVFTGLFTVQGATFARNLSREMELPGNDLYIIDRNGNVATSTSGDLPGAVTPFAAFVPELSEALRSRPRGHVGDRYYAAVPVSGTDWTLVTTVADRALYKPVQSVTYVAGWVVAIASVLGLVAVLALGWTTRSRIATSRKLELLNQTLEETVARRTAALNVALRQLHGQHEQHQRYAREVNDAIVQGLAAAEMAADLGEQAECRRLIRTTSAQARHWIGEQLRDGGAYAPGALRRARPADLRRVDSL